MLLYRKNLQIELIFLKDPGIPFYQNRARSKRFINSPEKHKVNFGKSRISGISDQNVVKLGASANKRFGQFFQLPLALANGKMDNSLCGFSHIILDGPADGLKP